MSSRLVDRRPNSSAGNRRRRTKGNTTRAERRQRQLGYILAQVLRRKHVVRSSTSHAPTFCSFQTLLLITLPLRGRVAKRTPAVMTRSSSDVLKMPTSEDRAVSNFLSESIALIIQSFFKNDALNMLHFILFCLFSLFVSGLV